MQKSIFTAVFGENFSSFTRFGLNRMQSALNEYGLFRSTAVKEYITVIIGYGESENKTDTAVIFPGEFFVF